MLLHNTPAMKRLRGDKGFTLVELLVVIVIIGILIAIAVPIFLNQREAAQKRAVESDVRNAVPALETYYSEHGEYPATADLTGLDDESADLITSDDGDLKISVSDDVSLEYTNEGESFTVTGGHKALDETVTFNSATGKLDDWE